MKTLIEAKNITLSYPPPSHGLRGLFSRRRKMPKALDDISFKVEAGAHLALVGLNGSGKSTLLRTIAGIYQPDDGEIEAYGEIASLFNLGIGMQIEVSGRKNIILQGMIKGKSRREMIDLTPSIIEFSELGNVIDDPIITYSQGMAMRLSFAIATALEPDILLLDEWIGAGDRVFRAKSEKRLEAMIKDSRGFVLASHNTTIVRRYCSQAMWLEKGKIMANGPTDEVLDAFEAATLV